MLVPPICMIFIIIWAAIWLYLMAHVYATGDIKAKPNSDALAASKIAMRVSLQPVHHKLAKRISDAQAASEMVWLSTLQPVHRK